MIKLELINKLNLLNKTEYFNEFIGEEYGVFLGIYFNYLIDLMLDKNNVKLIRDNINIVEELVESNKECILYLKEDLFLELFCTYGYKNELFFELSDNLKNIYNETIKDWIPTFKLFNIKYNYNGYNYIFLSFLDNNKKEILLINENYCFYKMDFENLEVIKLNKTYYEIYNSYPFLSIIR